MDCEPPSPSIITTISPNPHSRQPFGMIQKLCSTVLPAQICGNMFQIGGRRPRTIGPSRHYSSFNIDIETSQADSNSDIPLIVYDLAHSLICLLIVVFILLMALKCNGYVSSPPEWITGRRNVYDGVFEYATDLLPSSIFQFIIRYYIWKVFRSVSSACVMLVNVFQNSHNEIGISSRTQCQLISTSVESVSTSAIPKIKAISTCAWRKERYHMVYYTDKYEWEWDLSIKDYSLQVRKGSKTYPSRRTIKGRTKTTETVNQDSIPTEAGTKGNRIEEWIWNIAS